MQGHCFGVAHCITIRADLVLEKEDRKWPLSWASCHLKPHYAVVSAATWGMAALAETCARRL